MKKLLKNRKQNGLQTGQLAIISLMFLLLPLLLITTSPIKLAGVNLALIGQEPPQNFSVLEDLRLELIKNEIHITAKIRKQDANAAKGDTITNELIIPQSDLEALSQHLSSLKALDKTRTRIVIKPDDKEQLSSLIQVMDVAKSSFPDLVLTGKGLE